MAGRVAFALLVSNSAVMILVAWLTGTTGNPALTGALLAGAPLLIFLSGQIGDYRPDSGDLLFAAFVLAAATSFAANEAPPWRDAVLFALSLAAYPAGRVMRLGENPSTFIAITSGIVAIGTVATAIALAGQWNDMHGKPIVFGFDHAATVFLTSFGFLLLALVCFGYLWRLWLAALLAIPIVIFASSQVRFTLVAIAASLALAVGLVVKPKRMRRGVAVALAVGSVLVVAAVGLAIRSDKTLVFLKYAFSDSNPRDAGAGECGEMDNSIAIRRKLMRDSIAAVPTAGFFGKGLSSFERGSCLKMDPHNSVLQALGEFGWLGGSLFVLLIAAAWRRLWPVARAGPEAAFVLCALTYVAIIDMAHGHLASEGLLFLFTGYAVQARSHAATVTMAGAATGPGRSSASSRPA